MSIRLWPRNLAGQLAVLVAIALFVAQAINFGLLLQERRAARFLQITAPAVTRIVDAIERIDEGRLPPRFARQGLQQSDVNPLPPGAQRQPEIEAALTAALADAGVRVRRVAAGVRPITRDDPRLQGLAPRRARQIMRSGGELVIAVERPGGKWVSTRGPWPRQSRGLISRLIFQTFLLYAIVLIPVLWAGRRIARPLAALGQAARDFRPGAKSDPLPEAGPRDVREVITAFNALQLRVTAMLTEKDRMLGAIGHDLRTPLAALRVRIETVEDEPDRARMAAIIEEMSRTLDDILSLARLGRPSEAVTEVDIAALVDAVVEDFRDLGSDISFEPTARITRALRPSLMRRAVRNLIENALKFGGSATVRIAADPSEVRIEVEDNGPGVPEDRIADVFDAFTRLEDSRNRDTGGAGLGLALARAIVREAGGDIRLTNRAEGGLRASIELPRV